MPGASYRPDPGGIFDSDTHRRVLAFVPVPEDDPMPLRDLGVRISENDRFHGMSHVDELAEVLSELADDGYAKELKDGWRMTSSGHDALRAPIPDEGTGPAEPVLLGGL